MRHPSISYLSLGQWKRRSGRFKKCAYLVIAFLSLGLTFQFFYTEKFDLDFIFDEEFPFLLRSYIMRSYEDDGDIKNNKTSNRTCNIPQLTPWNEVTRRYWKIHEKVNCANNTDYPALFTTDLNSTLIQLDDPAKFNFTNCCYRRILTNFADNYERILWKCTPIKQRETVISVTVDLIQIFCNNKSEPNPKSPYHHKVLDTLGFARVKDATLTRLENFVQKNDTKGRDRLNVIIWGIDSTSRMNLQRILPLTFEYITKNLSAIGMEGYTKTGLNTLPNMVTALSSHTIDELEEGDKEKFFKRLKKWIIWKDFEREGFLTSFTEDAAKNGVFTYLRSGFPEPPVDIYGRPLMVQLETNIGHEKRWNYHLCYGHHRTDDYLIDYIKKVSRRMQELNSSPKFVKNPIPYFQMAWASALFHDYSTLGQLADGDILNMIRWFREETAKKLNDTIFIFMSDHGDRFGRMRYDTAQGRIEDKMPYLYFIFPPWFRSKYDQAISNLLLNSQQLTSHFDLYQTLKDFSNLERIENKEIERRTAHLKKQMSRGELPRGLSLMLPIPENRTCSQAGVPNEYCVCFEPTQLDINGKKAKDIEWAARSGVKYMNKFFKQEEVAQLCRPMTFYNVTQAQKMVIDYDFKVQDENFVKSETLKVSFYTQPGLAEFEGQFRRELPWGYWQLDGSLERLNDYGNSSHCVGAHRVLKTMCFCN